MKVAIVAPSPVPYAAGGAERLWWGLLEAFRRYTDHEIELIKAPTRERDMGGLLDGYRYWSGLDLDHFDLVISTKYPAWMVRHHNHWVYLQHRLRGLYDTYPAHLPRRPFEGAWPGRLARLRDALARPPRPEYRGELFDALYEARDALPEDLWQRWFALPGPLARLAVRWLDDSALRPGAIRKYMAISATVASRRDYFPPGASVQVIHHPSDLAPAEPAGSDYFFTAGRLDGPKRVDLLVRAFMAADVAQWLLIAGAGPRADALRTLAAADGRIRFLGRLSDAELRRYYAGALCVPFVPEDEDYGLIAVEALQAGKPVLTLADSGGVAELVEDGRTGWIVEPDAAALTRAIERIGAAPESAVAMRRACLERGGRIEWESTLRALLDTEYCMDGLGNRELGKPRRILVPLTYPVWPPRSGGPNRVFHLYRRIARCTPVTLLTLCGAGEEGMDAEIAAGLRELRIPKSADYQRAERELERRLGASVTDLYAIDHAGDMREFVRALRAEADAADLVIASHPYLYRAIRAVYRGPIYYEAHNVEFDMKRAVLAGAPGARPWLDLIEATEGACARDALAVCACSARDRERLHRLYGLPPESIELVPNGVSAAEIPMIGVDKRRRVAARLLRNSRAAVLFVGSWHGPNIEAVQWLMDDLAGRCPDLGFWVVGSVCDFWQREGNKSAPENVLLMGRLDEADKNAVLSCAQVAINPVDSGSGSNLKMAEYVCAGLPVLSTPFGCRGLEVADLPTVRLARRDDFADRLKALVDELLRGELDGAGPAGRPEGNEESRESEERGARALIEAREWDGIADAYYTHLVSAYRRRLLERRRGGDAARA